MSRIHWMTVVRDHSGQALSSVYYESEPGRQAAAERRKRMGPLILEVQ